MRDRSAHEVDEHPSPIQPSARGTARVHARLLANAL